MADEFVHDWLQHRFDVHSVAMVSIPGNQCIDIDFLVFLSLRVVLLILDRLSFNAWCCSLDKVDLDFGLGFLRLEWRFLWGDRRSLERAFGNLLGLLVLERLDDLRIPDLGRLDRELVPDLGEPSKHMSFRIKVVFLSWLWSREVLRRRLNSQSLHKFLSRFANGDQVQWNTIQEIENSCSLSLLEQVVKTLITLGLFPIQVACPLAIAFKKLACVWVLLHANKVVKHLFQS